MKTRVLWALVLMCGTAMAAGSEPGAARAAEELAKITLSPETYQKTLDAMIAQTGAAMRQQQPDKVPANFEAIMRDSLNETMSYKDMVQFLVDVLGRHYTEGEIRELTDFYKRPIGQKVLREQPAIMGETMNHVVTVVQQRLPEALRRATEKNRPQKAPAAKGDRPK